VKEEQEEGAGGATGLKAGDRLRRAWREAKVKMKQAKAEQGEQGEEEEEERSKGGGSGVHRASATVCPLFLFLGIQFYHKILTYCINNRIPSL